MMRKRYLCMVELQEQLVQLFDLCGVESDFMKVTPMPTPLLFLEKLIQDRQLYDYLENLTALSSQAVEKMKEIKLEVWNGLENERRLDSLADQVEEQKAQIVKAKEDQEQLKTENSKLLAQLQQERKQIVNRIIMLRDNLQMKKDWLNSTEPGNLAAAKFIDGQLDETAGLLKDLGVEILQDTGAFDSRCHTAVSTKPTDDLNLDGQIAETFRPGYRFQETTLRPQEVIVYTKA